MAAKKNGDIAATDGKKSSGKKRINVHIITDSTGETTLNICKVAMTQFPDHETNLLLWPFTDTTAQIDLIMDSIKKNKGIIMCSILPKDVSEYLHSEIAKLNSQKDDEEKDVIIVNALTHVVKKISGYTGASVLSTHGRDGSKEDVEYIKRMNAIEYATAHDDGRSMAEFDKADIVIVGVSRTGKTPVSLYLAYRGFNVINVPFVSEETMPDAIYKNEKQKLIIGITIDPIRLMGLRENRVLSSAGKPYSSNYTDLKSIEDELFNCKRFFRKLTCPTIDITHKSVEETSAQIIKIHNLTQNK